MVCRFVGFLGDVASIMQLLGQAAARYGLDPQLVINVARRESGLNPNAVSSAGAKGIMQLMDATAAALGVSNPFDVVQNINAGARYLAQLLNQFGGDLAKALAAYNWGPGAVAKAIQTWGEDWLAHAPAETQAYVRAIAGISPLPGPLPGPSDSSFRTGVTAEPPPLTIDAETGQVIQDTTATPAGPGWLPNTPQGKFLLLTGAAIGAFFLADFLRGD